MSNEITTGGRGQPPAQFLEPSLPSKLSALLDRRENYQDLPVIGPKSAAQLRNFIEAPQPNLPGHWDVKKMLAMLDAALPKRGMTDEQAQAIMGAYWEALQDVPLDALNHAYRVIMREDSWFPTVARIREASAGSMPSTYRARRLVAKSLLMKHRAEWREPIADADKADPSEVAEVLAALACADGPVARAIEVSERPKRRYCPICLFASDNPLTGECMSNRAALCGLSAEYVAPVEEAAE